MKLKCVFNKLHINRINFSVYLYILFITFLLFLYTNCESDKQYKNNSNKVNLSLIGTISVFRHGARSSTKLKKFSSKYLYNNFGGFLTITGVNQLQYLGLYFKDKYCNYNNLLHEENNCYENSELVSSKKCTNKSKNLHNNDLNIVNNIELYSSPKHRAIASMNSFLNGLISNSIVNIKESEKYKKLLEEYLDQNNYNKYKLESYGENRLGFVSERELPEAVLNKFNVDYYSSTHNNTYTHEEKELIENIENSYNINRLITNVIPDGLFNSHKTYNVKQVIKNRITENDDIKNIYNFTVEECIECIQEANSKYEGLIDSVKEDIKIDLPIDISKSIEENLLTISNNNSISLDEALKILIKYAQKIFSFLKIVRFHHPNDVLNLTKNCYYFFIKILINQHYKEKQDHIIGDKLAKISADPWLKVIKKDIKELIAKNEKTLLIDNPYHYVYSGHEENIEAIMSYLYDKSHMRYLLSNYKEGNNFNDLIPPFSSILTFEIYYSTIYNSYFLRVLLNNIPQNKLIYGLNYSDNKTYINTNSKEDITNDLFLIDDILKYFD